MADGEAPVGGAPDLTGGSNRRGRRDRSFTNINAKVSVDGLNDLASVLKKIADSTKEIRKNFEAINAAGRAGGGLLNKITGGRMGGTNMMPHLAGVVGQQQQQRQQQVPGQPQGTGVPGTPGTANTLALWLPGVMQRQPAAAATGGPPAAGVPAQQQAAPEGGTGGTTMPWMNRIGSAALVGANILSGRIGRNLQESAPLSSQASLMATMYGGMGMRYNQIEMDRFRDLGRYGGTRQEQAMTQGMALKMGQTPTQAGQFMQGIGNMVQAMGGTMTASQATETAGGFLDPMVLRRQRAQGMQMARVGGQVRNPMTVAQDYVKNYEQRYNGGRKLNEFDFINLQAAGHPLRITFARLYGLDEASIDLVATAGMQTIGAGGRLDYGSSAAIAQQLGQDRSRLGLAVTSMGTATGRREASFAQQNEQGMVTQVRMEESWQNIMTGVEDAASGLTNSFAALDKIIKVVSVGLGAMLGGGMMAGMAGRGGAGIAGVAAQALGGAGGGVPGAVPAAGRGAGMMGMLGQGALGVGGAMAGIGAISTAANARSWGDVFSAGAQGAAGGAMFGAMSATPFGPVVGAAGGFILAAGGAAISKLLGGDGGEAQQIASRDAGNLTDKEIIAKVAQLKRSEAGGGGLTRGPAGHPIPIADAPRMPGDWKLFTDVGNSDIEGLIDRYQIRRSALIYQFMDAVQSRTPIAFTNMIKRRLEGDDEEPTQENINKRMTDWQKIATKFRKFASEHEVDDGDYATAGEELIEITRMLRGEPDAYERDWEGYDELHAVYTEYFEDLEHPMLVQPVYSEPAFQIIKDYSYNSTDLAASLPPEEDARGDPVDASSASTNQYLSVERMPMADPPTGNSTWGGLHPTFKKRLLAMFAAAKGKLGLGEGTRSTESQRNMFLDRYRPGPGPGQVEWNGQVWHHVKGAAAAPPGRSMHEIGLAADLTGPMVGGAGWKSFVAKFGLREFSDVNDEPWHVQPAELPGGRSTYEEEGAIWGTGGAPIELAGDIAVAPQDAAVSIGGGGGGGFSGIGGSSLGALGLGGSSLSLLQAGAGGGGGGGGAAIAAPVSVAADTNAVADVSGPASPQSIYAYLRSQGVSEASAAGILANIKYESGFDPYNATGDNGTSGGLFQHHAGRWAALKEYAASTDREWTDWAAQVDFALQEARSYGINLQSSDPQAAAREWTLKFERPANAATRATERAAVAGNYMFGDGEFDTGMDARGILGSHHSGDAVFDSGVGTGGLSLPRGGVGRSPAAQMLGGGGRGLNVHVTITSTGNYAYDAKQLAKHVRPAFEQEYAEVSAKRNM